jgi:hypothetical protein
MSEKKACFRRIAPTRLAQVPSASMTMISVLFSKADIAMAAVPPRRGR